MTDIAIPPFGRNSEIADATAGSREGVRRLTVPEYLRRLEQELADAGSGRRAADEIGAWAPLTGGPLSGLAGVVAPHVGH